jgi:hypothetical protein
MSAYICDRRHIHYLVAAAKAVGQPHGFRWHYQGQWRELDHGNRVGVANLLWQENIASVKARYPGEQVDTLPGPGAGEEKRPDAFRITRADFPANFPSAAFEPAQIFKACDCYEYQSCEHEGWDTSEARAFINALRRSTWQSVPGYEGAEWGAPEKEAA